MAGEQQQQQPEAGGEQQSEAHPQHTLSVDLGSRLRAAALAQAAQYQKLASTFRGDAQLSETVAAFYGLARTSREMGEAISAWNARIEQRNIAD